MELKEKKEIKINLGSGTDYKAGFVNIDKNRKTRADIYLDMEKQKLPFEKNSVDEIYCNHVIEHLINIPFALQEMERVIKPSGKVILTIPHFNYLDFHADLTHRAFCTTKTFSEIAQRDNYGTNFVVEKMDYAAKLKKIVGWIGLENLEKIGWPICHIVFYLTKKSE